LELLCVHENALCMQAVDVVSEVRIWELSFQGKLRFGGGF
jgi:hypothetical protein